MLGLIQANKDDTSPSARARRRRQEKRKSRQSKQKTSLGGGTSNFGGTKSMTPTSQDSTKSSPTEIRIVSVERKEVTSNSQLNTSTAVVDEGDNDTAPNTEVPESAPNDDSRIDEKSTSVSSPTISSTEAGVDGKNNEESEVEGPSENTQSNTSRSEDDVDNHLIQYDDDDDDDGNNGIEDFAEGEQRVRITAGEEHSDAGLSALVHDEDNDGRKVPDNEEDMDDTIFKESSDTNPSDTNHDNNDQNDETTDNDLQSDFEHDIYEEIKNDASIDVDESDEQKEHDSTGINEEEIESHVGRDQIVEEDVPIDNDADDTAATVSDIK